MSNKYTLLFAIVLVVIFVDQWSKQLAVRYLRSPGDSDYRKEYFQECTRKFDRCNQLCRTKSLHQPGSLLACKKTCEVQKKQCRNRLKGAYDRAKLAWKDQVTALRASPMCRRVVSPTSSRPECVVVENYFHFTYRTNSGAAWGIFSTLDDRVRRPFFIMITMVAILFIFYLFIFRLESEHMLMIIALALILGGALGNFIDRLRLDYVIDFIEWFWRSRSNMTWPTFNIADAAISIGVGLIGIELLFFAPPDEYYDPDGKKEEDETEHAASETPADGASQQEVTTSEPTAEQTAPPQEDVASADGEAGDGDVVASKESTEETTEVPVKTSEQDETT